MTGLDASFLYMETPTVAMHTVNVLIFDVSRMRGGYSFDRLLHLFERRLHLVPLLRRRVVEVPWALHHPMWVEDPEFDLTRHLRRATLAPPGDMRAFDALVGEILSTHMWRAHPLWEIVVVEGLEGGLVALVCKFHHAMIDGAAIATLVEQIMSGDPESHEVSPPTEVWASESIPGPGALVREALRERLLGLARMPRLLGETARAVIRLLRRWRAHELELSLPFSGPSASFNARITAWRSFSTIDLPIAELVAIKDAVGCTLNDVVLGVAAAGLRRFMVRHGEPLRRPLLAGVPVATGDPAEVRVGGNKVSNLLVSLRTDIEDPVERLRAIHELTGSAKHAHDLEIGGLLEKWAEYARPWLVRLVFDRVMRWAPRPPINLVISNVRGSREPHYLAGAALLRLYLGGPLIERLGVNLTVWSYCDTVHLAAVACPERLLEVEELLGDCAAALAEIRAAVRPPQLGAAPP